MKIKLELSTDTLIACNQLLQEIYNESNPNTEAGKLVKSIALEVADKLDSKCKTLIKKATIFDQGKKHQLSLKYHEAWGFYRALCNLIDYVNNDYKQTLIQKTINTLNQKLT